MLNKAFNSLDGVFAAMGEASHGAAPANPESNRKPSNLTVRAALKRKRLAASGNTKPEPKKPA